MRVALVRSVAGGTVIDPSANGTVIDVAPVKGGGVLLPERRPRKGGGFLLPGREPAPAAPGGTP